ncbi:CinA family protein [Legionella fairfieldensis]|uniref:CinA family protein n=1 Tax=Legionella fairfieldensis TaxID=45064 RepID=UPI0004902A18|nr:CinA family protein [Legionella fairfieldensis]
MNDFNNLLLELTHALRANQLKIATAESCTGGLIAGLLTELPGSSLWFERGFVTYSNLAKQEMLGVKDELIGSYGAVSKEVAEAMALGALSHSVADISLAVTGIAGPDGGSVEKPVGTVWFAWAKTNTLVKSEQCLFANKSRQEVRQLTCAKALKELFSLVG